MLIGTNLLHKQKLKSREKPFRVTFMSTEICPSHPAVNEQPAILVHYNKHLVRWWHLRIAWLFLNKGSVVEFFCFFCCSKMELESIHLPTHQREKKLFLLGEDSFLQDFRFHEEKNQTILALVAISTTLQNVTKSGTPRAIPLSPQAAFMLLLLPIILPNTSQIQRVLGKTAGCREVIKNHAGFMLILGKATDSTSWHWSYLLGKR